MINSPHLLGRKSNVIQQIMFEYLFLFKELMKHNNFDENSL